MIISEDKEMAETLNGFFTSVFTRENTENIPVSPNLNISGTYLSNLQFSKSEVEEKIKLLKTDSSPGPDKISARLLQLFASRLAGPLTSIFNSSVTSGEVPTDWRLANITPIFKKGAKGDPSNYRPVSLTSVCCKIIESLIKDKVVDHLIINNLINAS